MSDCWLSRRASSRTCSLTRSETADTSAVNRVTVVRHIGHAGDDFAAATSRLTHVKQKKCAHGTLMHGMNSAALSDPSPKHIEQPGIVEDMCVRAGKTKIYIFIVPAAMSTTVDDFRQHLDERIMRSPHAYDYEIPVPSKEHVYCQQLQEWLKDMSIAMVRSPRQETWSGSWVCEVNPCRQYRRNVLDSVHEILLVDDTTTSSTQYVACSRCPNGRVYTANREALRAYRLKAEECGEDELEFQLATGHQDTLDDVLPRLCITCYVEKKICGNK